MHKILTGKCKRTFLKWLKIRVNSTLHEIDKIEFWFNLQDESFKNALIIEWFDEIKHPKIQIVRIIWNTWSNSTLSYKETVIEAIKKANEIYNSK